MDILNHQLSSKLEQLKKQAAEHKDDKPTTSWQEYAVKTCELFGITAHDKIGRSVIFRQAKKNMSFLQGKVELCREKFGSNGLKDKGRYLVKLFGKTRPWEG